MSPNAFAPKVHYRHRRPTPSRNCDALAALNSWVAPRHRRDPGGMHRPYRLTAKNPFQTPWMAKKEKALVASILSALNLDAYEYKGFSTGNYGPGDTQPGVTLQLISLVGHDSVHAVFNAHLTRLRTVRSGSKGKRLPGKRFRVSERSHSISFGGRQLCQYLKASRRFTTAGQTQT